MTHSRTRGTRMFRNYLTYNIGLSFQRSCQTLAQRTDLSGLIGLTQSAGTFINHFARSIYTRDKKEESRLLFVALLALRDCKDILIQAKATPEDHAAIWAQYELLHARMEQICLKASEGEDGQYRMLG